MRPMLASPATGIPDGDDWIHEVKWDGMRVLADVRDGVLTLTSRVGNDVTASYPELADLGDAYDDMLLDGEVVALEGGPSLVRRARRPDARARPAQGRAAGHGATGDLHGLRPAAAATAPTSPPSRCPPGATCLERLDLSGRHWQVPPVYEDGQELFAATLEQGLEGVVSKRLSAPYLPGRRSTDWLKSPHRATLSAVVGGWRPEKTNDSGRLGAVLLGRPGRRRRLAVRRADGQRHRRPRGSASSPRPSLRTPAPDSPFSDEVPRIDSVGATWVDPVVVVEARTLEVTRDGRLRQPAYLGIRTDLTPEDLQEVDGA